MRLIFRPGVLGVLACLSMLAGWSAVSAQDAKAPDYEAIVASPDRSDADPRDAAVFGPQIPVDEFVLKYQKPS